MLAARRFSLMILKATVCLFACYGMAWLALSKPIMRRTCEARLWGVYRDAILAEKAGDSLAAAHRYAHLIAYGAGTESDCASPEVIDGTWKLPLVEALLQLRWNETQGVDHEIFRSPYLENLMNARLPAQPDQSPATSD